MLIVQFLSALALASVCFANECMPRDYGHGATVCVCSSAYCDTLPILEEASNGQYQIITSNRDGLRFKTDKGVLYKTESQNKYLITVDHSRKHQTVEGFGGAFTDATGINIKTLPQEVEDQLMEAYFGDNGAEYSLCRVPIAGTDSSTRAYSYADDTPGTLDSFSLQEEDYLYKIPLIQKANILSGGKLHLLASPWSSPKWMKTNNDWFAAPLYENYYELWTEYIMQFFEEYRKNGIEYWGLTQQNQPNTYMFINDTYFNSVSWTPSQLITWLDENLGPTVRNSNFSHLKIVIHDDMTGLANQLQEYFADNIALGYLDGVAFHWYSDVVNGLNESVFALAKTDKKDVFMIYTEASYGGDSVQLGNWERGSGYAQHIIRVLNSDAIGWIDWNLVLNQNGGPNHIDNYGDSAIVVNTTSGEFYKQPMYYALAHFSKYIPRGSIRINSTISPELLLAGVYVVALERPDNRTVLVVLNQGDETLDIQVADGSEGNINIAITPQSINTVLYTGSASVLKIKLLTLLLLCLLKIII